MHVANNNYLPELCAHEIFTSQKLENVPEIHSLTCYYDEGWVATGNA